MKIRVGILNTMVFAFILLTYSCKSTQQSESIEVDEVVDEATIEVDPIRTDESPIHEAVLIDTYDAVDMVDAPAEIRSEKMSKASSAMMMADASVRRTSGGTKNNLPSAGQITAGEWNDRQNWKDWIELTQDEDYVQMQSYWGIYPEKRVTVFVTNSTNQPIPAAQVTLTNLNGSVIWKSMTDHSGHAELWANLYRAKQDNNYQIKVNYDGEEYVRGEVKLIEEGTNDIKLPVDCNEQHVVDIMFVVDATGSMGDEISFLQSELNDVLERATIENADLSYRTGAVFYRDDTDEYLTRVSDLNSNKDITTEFISQQSANGGGDYPEAVEAGLEEALAQNWSDKALSKIIFLLLDAPPHKDSTSMDMIKESVEDASALGIKIIPITASGINRETEFLMKYMAILTNATYVFITDDSGIGNPHLDPVVKDYEVEKLNDLLVRLIANYTKVLSCNIDFKSTKEGSLTLFPNPTSNRITVKSDDDINTIKVLSNSGKELIVESVDHKKEVEIALDNLIDGVYQIAIYHDNKQQQIRSVIKVSG